MRERAGGSERGQASERKRANEIKGEEMRERKQAEASEPAMQSKKTEETPNAEREGKLGGYQAVRDAEDRRLHLTPPP